MNIRKLTFAFLIVFAASVASIWPQNVLAQNEVFDNLTLVDGIYTRPELILDSTELFGSESKTHIFADQIRSFAVMNDLDTRYTRALSFARSSNASISTTGQTSMNIAVSGLRLGPAYNFQTTQYESPWLFIDSTSGNPRHEVLAVLANKGGAGLKFENTNVNTAWETSILNNGDFRISLDGSGGHEFRLLRNGRLIIGPGNKNVFDLRPNGNLIIGGTLVQSSDRNKKENFSDVDCQSILEQLTQVPIQTWNYKSDEDSIRHIGPMAQDFYLNFQVGQNDKTISTIDTAGVTMAAIKALAEENRAISEDNKVLADENKTLRQNDRRLDQQNKQLMEMVENLGQRMSVLEMSK